MRSLITFCCIFFASLQMLHAQSHAVYGMVNVFDSIPLIGVEVTVKSTKQTVLTDSVGQFSVICEDKDKLKIEATGFYPENITITKDVKMVAVNLRMKPGEKQREYAIGYGYISEKDRSTAISLMENDNKFSRYSKMDDLLNSMGVQIIGGQYVLRGTTSFQGSSSALIVVDDVIVDASFLGSLDPKEVNSINIIKDGSSAIYGSRGANGVILIETKKGGE